MPSLRLRSISSGRRGPESVFSGPRVRIGRSRDNDLILPEKQEPSAGSHHAEALLDASGIWWIVDNHSTNGTFVNGLRIGRQRIASGDRLTFGDEQVVATIGGIGARAVVGSILLALIASAAVAFILVTRGDRQQAPPFERVAAGAARAVFLVVLEEGGVRTPIGTAFAVDNASRSNLLVTNAHVAAQLESSGAFSSAPTKRALAVQGDSYLSRRIARVSIAPRWRAGSIQDDVALLELDGIGPPQPPAEAVPALILADSGQLAAIARGTPVAALGFPAASTDVQRPRGRLSVDVVGDVRGDYLETGLGIAPGTSGSPVFDEAGAVIGIVAGGDFVGGAAEPRRPSGSAANWVLSASVIRKLLD